MGHSNAIKVDTMYERDGMTIINVNKVNYSKEKAFQNNAKVHFIAQTALFMLQNTRINGAA